MTWKLDDPQGNESGKIRWEIVKWTRGKGLDVGCGGNKAFPHMIGVDNGTDIQLFGHQFKPDVWIDDASDLKLFGTESMDFVYSSHVLEHIPFDKVVKCLKEWLRVIKNNGYLVLYLPDETLYPKVGEPGANPDHKWNVSYALMVEMMEKAGNWDLVDWQRRDGGTEYSLFMVFQKKAKGHAFSCTHPKPAKTAAVVRYGAYGDVLQASSVFKGLKDQGYHVTVFCSPPGSDVILHDPNIDEFYFQDKDQVPNHALGVFWDYHAKKYDRWVNLSESAEGTLLALPGRFLHGTPPRLRHKLANMNYLELQHDAASVPHKPQVHFYAQPDEVIWAQNLKKRMGNCVLVWSLAGSSVHKTWPFVDNIIAALLIEFPGLHVVLVGGPAAVLLEQGWFKVGEDGQPVRDAAGKKIQVDARVHPMSGDWAIRQTMAFAQVADIVAGPETGVLNAVSHEDNAKVVFLSHSSHENLTRDWSNTHVLLAESTHCPGRGQNEAPACHQLHYGWDHCKNAVAEDGKPSGIAQCQMDITPEHAHRVIWHVVTGVLEASKAA
jgi:predicted SAM-dependent methyltransferase/ADP-heptose:LPS heptosyltransferase